jgi:hypothetical protein
MNVLHALRNSMILFIGNHKNIIGSPGAFIPQLPQHPACGSARGASSGVERNTNKMATSNAGSVTNRQPSFTRSGAILELRLGRLARCRRFRPSPCPTHYGGRLATMPSADFCPITSRVTPGRAPQAQRLAAQFARIGRQPAVAPGLGEPEVRLVC